MLEGVDTSKLQMNVTFWEPHQIPDSERDAYAMLGHLIAKIASLEVRLDDVLFKFCDKYPRLTGQIGLSLAGKHDFYPLKYRDKTDFMINAIIMLPPLRRVGDLDGMLHLNQTGYAFDEIFDVRNQILHSSLIGILKENERIVLSFKKYTRIRRGEFRSDDFSFSNVYVRRLLELASYLKSRLHTLVAILDGADMAKEADELRKGRLQTNAILQSLADQEV